jgi:hypothetical protein
VLEWVLVPSAAWVHLLVYLHPYPKELMLRNHVQVEGANCHSSMFGIGIWIVSGLLPWDRHMVYNEMEPSLAW